jgi:hypothetical protein
VNPTAAAAETGRRHLSHIHSIQEMAALTNRPDCPAVLHLALRVLTATETTWPGHPTALLGRRAMHTAPGRRIAPRTRDAALSQGPHHVLGHTLARHQSHRDAVSTTGFVRALRLVTKMLAPATSDLDLQTTTTLPPTRTLDASKFTTRKRMRTAIVTTDTLHVAGPVVPIKANFRTTQETMADCPATIWIYLHATSAADSPITPPLVMQRQDVHVLLLSKRRVPCLHPKHFLHSQLTISLSSRSKAVSQLPRRQNNQGMFAIMRAIDVLLPP